MRSFKLRLLFFLIYIFLFIILEIYFFKHHAFRNFGTAAIFRGVFSEVRRLSSRKLANCLGF